MGDLADRKFDIHQPFTNVALDLTGPHTVKFMTQESNDKDVVFDYLMFELRCGAHSTDERLYSGNDGFPKPRIKPGKKSCPEGYISVLLSILRSEFDEC